MPQPSFYRKKREMHAPFPIWQFLHLPFRWTVTLPAVISYSLAFTFVESLGSEHHSTPPTLCVLVDDPVNTPALQCLDFS